MHHLSTDLTDLELAQLRQLLESAPIGDFGIIIAKLLPSLPEAEPLWTPAPLPGWRRQELARKHAGDEDRSTRWISLLQWHGE
jgi:hypothetical protein